MAPGRQRQRQCRPISDKNRLADVIEQILMSDMAEPVALQVAEQSGLRVFRGSASAGSLMFVPAGMAVVERGIGTDMPYGWRTSIIETPEVVKTLEPLVDMVKKSGGTGNPTATMYETVKKCCGVA